MKTPRQFQGWRIGGLRLLSSRWTPDGRCICLASYHHPKRMCWLWFAEITFTKIWRFNIFKWPGHQTRWGLQIPGFYAQFVWQEEGRYTDPSDRRMRELAGVKEWPQKLTDGQ